MSVSPPKFPFSFRAPGVALVFPVFCLVLGFLWCYLVIFLRLVGFLLFSDVLLSRFLFFFLIFYIVIFLFIFYCYFYFNFTVLIDFMPVVSCVFSVLFLLLILAVFVFHLSLLFFYLL